MQRKSIEIPPGTIKGMESTDCRKAEQAFAKTSDSFIACGARWVRGNKDRASEIAQDAMLDIIRNIRERGSLGYDSSRSSETNFLIYGYLWRCYKNELRHRNILPKTPGTDIVAHIASLENILVEIKATPDSELVHDIINGIADIPNPTMRDVAILSFLYDIDRKSVQRALGLSRTTVNNYNYETRKWLKSVLVKS